MPKLAIIADDLTGALDASAPFAMSGKVVVATRIEALHLALREQPDVIAVSTRSREIDPDQARARVARALSALPPGIRIFKKIDSRLKGNIAAELDALPQGPMLIVPAIPDYGRLVSGGHVTGFGVSTAIDIARAIGPRAATATIPDTANTADILAALRAAPADSILVGARGLAQALCAGLPQNAEVVDALPDPFCLVVGSTDPITLAQVAALRRTRPDLNLVEAPAGVVPPPGKTMADLTLIRLTPGEALAADRAAHRFAQGVAPWLAPAQSLLLTGGATAEAVLDQLESDVLTISGEVLPGLPCCREGQRRIITKSGGFGAEDTFVQLAGLVKTREGCRHD